MLRFSGPTLLAAKTLSSRFFVIVGRQFRVRGWTGCRSGAVSFQQFGPLLRPGNRRDLDQSIGADRSHERDECAHAERNEEEPGWTDRFQRAGRANDPRAEFPHDRLMPEVE